MKKSRNMHTLDRYVRLTIGVTCIYIGFIDTSLIANRIVAALVGVFGVTNLWAFYTARCPVYAMTGFSTLCSAKPASKE